MTPKAPLTYKEFRRRAIWILISVFVGLVVTVYSFPVTSITKRDPATCDPTGSCYQFFEHRSITPVSFLGHAVLIYGVMLVGGGLMLAFKEEGD